ncbi:MAG: hypothetical protein JNL73_19850 [Anaerolineales bacterium]|nr:hypothetical protein [Anaerolineales bacterium]
MELVLTLNTQIARVNDALMATLTLRNDSEAAVLVNTRLVVNRAGAPAGFRDVSFNVTGPDGEALPLAVKVNVGAPQPQHFQLLGPGESATRTVELHRLFALRKAGDYAIAAVYRAETDPADGRTAWRGSIESAAVGVRLEPAG